MLLSSVNFVAKTKTGKSKEVSEKKADIKDAYKPVAATESMCRLCRKEMDDEEAIFKFPSAPTANNDVKKNSKGPTNTDIKDKGSRVSITSSDDMCLTVDQFYYTIGLKEESKCDNTCIFRKKVLKSKQLPNGVMETAVFVLDCDQDFYMTTNKQRDLELNYFACSPNVNTTDERIFEIYFTDVGHCLIQPLCHKNAYLHHLDKTLSIQPFDLNWRCPEEYFFHFNAVPEPVVQRKKRRTHKVCHHQKEIVQVPSQHKTLDTIPESQQNSTSDNEKPRPQTWSICNTMNAKLMEEMPERFYIELPTRKSCKNKKAFSNLLLGCFGGKSSRIVMGST